MLFVIHNKQLSIRLGVGFALTGSIALQADLFAKNGSITNPIFSDINRQEDGVHFNLTALVNPASLNFVRLINGSNTEQQAPATDTSHAQQQQPDPFAGPQNAASGTPKHQ